MPIVKLGGRLGNQLFQIAFGISQSLRSRTPLELDLRGITPNQQESLETWIGSLTVASPAEVQATLGDDGLRGKLHRIRQRLKAMSERTWILQRHSNYHERYLEPRHQAYFDGYWQSYRYFQKSRDFVLRQVQYRVPLTSEGEDLVALMEQQGTVSVHIRRGDYLGSPSFVLPSPAFYQDALNQIASSQFLSHVFVFSDDPLWCQQELNLGRSFRVIVDQPAEVDLFLMSRCQHHVVGTSTFSWWGAWLGSRPGVVVAPRRWFASYGKTPPLSDVYPPEWILL